MSLFDVVKPSLCESGKIKIGGKGDARKSQGGGEYRLPVKYDHFSITTLHRNPAGDLIEDKSLMDELKQQYSDMDGKLRRIPITVLSNDIEDVLQSAYVFYSGKKCVARSDGTKIIRYGKDGKWLKTPIEEPFSEDVINEKDAKGNTKFKLHTKLNCVVVSSRCRFGGVYIFRTTSIISARQLLGSLMQIKELTGGQDRGVLRGLPLQLVVRPMQVTPEALNGKSSTVHVVHVELLAKDLMSVQQMALERAKFELENRQQLTNTTIKYRQLLALPGVNESPVEAAEIAEEFHPEDESNERQPPSQTDPLAAQLGLLGEEQQSPTEAKQEPVKEAPQPEPQSGEFQVDEEYLADMSEWQQQGPPK